jgi:hypothetical protein
LAKEQRLPEAVRVRVDLGGGGPTGFPCQE